MTKDKNLLVVTWTAYPPTSGSGIILNNLLKQFDPKKVVLAGEYTYGQDKKEYEKPPYPIHILNHSFHTGVKGSNHLKILAVNRVSNQIRSLIKQYQIEVILAVFPDELYTISAYKIAKEQNLPFYVWMHNTYLDNRKGLRRLIARIAQPRIFSLAIKVYTMSLGMNDFYVKNYPNLKSKFEPLLHGFDIPFDNTDQVDVELNGKVKFLLSGNINHSNKDATQRLALAVLQEDEENELHIFGGNSEEEWHQIGIKGKNVFIHGFIPLIDLVNSFKYYDIVLLPHGFEGNLSQAEYETIFPTRTIPLLYSGKPILAHCPLNTAITIMLRDSKSGLLTTEKNIQAIIDNIKLLKKDKSLRKSLVIAAKQASKSYDVKIIGTQLKNEIFRH